MEGIINKAITAIYELHDVTDGNDILLEAVTESQPMKLITGLGMMPLTAFEDKLTETPTGEEFELIMTPEQGFGEYIEARVISLDKTIFMQDGVFDDVNIRPTAIVPLQNEQGDRFMAQVKEVTDDKVIVDLNHPLAGKTLLFKGQMLESHDASEEEIMALLNQMRGGCGGCGGGGCNGNCGGGCGGNCDGNCQSDCNK